VELGLLREDDDGEFRVAVSDPSACLQPDSDAARVLFRASLVRIPAFVTFAVELRRSSDAALAARMASAVHQIAPPLREGDRCVFVDWGLFAGVLERSDGTLAVAGEVGEADPEGVLADCIQWGDELSHELAARVRIETLLTPEVSASLPPAVVDDLVSAIQQVSSDQHAALQRAGVALEDALKYAAKSRGVPLTTPGGKRIDQIGALAQQLRQHKGIADKHVNVLRGLETFVEHDVLQGYAAFRNMPSHGSSVEDWERWQLGPEIAWCILVQVCLTIRSIQRFVIDQKRTY
jgi:hypothetical protein